MFKYATLLFVALFAPLSSHAATDEDLRAIRAQIQQLEQRLQPASRPAASSESAFNPAISLILSGTYGQYDEAEAAATGFAMSPNDTGYTQGFSLKESELIITANIDPQFRGVGIFALDPDGAIAVEEGYVQTTALGNGLNFKMGRYFSGLGYLNEKHAHARDFIDQPLVYRTLWENQLSEDGVQLKWLAPTATFLEVGAEIGRGRGFPGTTGRKMSGAGVLFAHVGDDIGTDHSWRAGASWHQTKRVNAISDNVPDLPGTDGGVSNSFSGNSRTAGVDFVWKYAPNGNIRQTNFRLQGEYFQRKENGLLTYDYTPPGSTLAGANTPSSYAVTQSGWYLQSVYQFMPHWRAGLRYDQLAPGNAQIGALNVANVISNVGYTPTRSSLMLDYSPSEFSRLRVQVAQDKSRQGLTDNQLFLQYIMSLGAHGAHQF